MTEPSYTIIGVIVGLVHFSCHRCGALVPYTKWEMHVQWHQELSIGTGGRG